MSNKMPKSWILNPLKWPTFAQQSFLLPRQWKQLSLLAIDLCFIPLAVWLAVIVRWGGTDYPLAINDIIAIVTTMAISAIIFLRIGLYRAIVRFMGQQAILSIVKAVTLSSLTLAIVAFGVRSDIPRATPFIYWTFALLLIGGSRLLVRSLYQSLAHSSGKSVVIYGAGVSGRQLLSTLLPGEDYRPIAFIDDDEQLIGSVIHGVSVYSSDQLTSLVSSLSVRYVFLALPSVATARRKEIIDKLQDLPVHVKTVPSFNDLMSGTADVGQLLEVDLADLLGRDIVPPDPQLMMQCIQSKVVMVTGGGGSIGLELCRQIIRCEPRELILLDISEYALYEATKELTQQIKLQGLICNIVPLLGSTLDEKRLTTIFKTFNVKTVYHAAAYKHVPIVEYNVVSGVFNNVFGTLYTGRAAITAQVKTFVLISTDKAVRPTSVMGASKRAAELVLQALNQQQHATRFCIVRFGNVLGSSGSVVPLFRQQVYNGGPITITHKDATRFFMTIPEAAQLVIQASALAQGGDVFVLDMGEPVRILNLAKRLARCMGAEIQDEDHPKGEITIHFSGLRPGEKLYEEPLLSKDVTGTAHPKIMRTEKIPLSQQQIQIQLQALEAACERNDCTTIYRILQEMVSEFSAKYGISDGLWERQSPLTDDKNVVQGHFGTIKP